MLCWTWVDPLDILSKRIGALTSRILRPLSTLTKENLHRCLRPVCSIETLQCTIEPGTQPRDNMAEGACRRCGMACSTTRFRWGTFDFGVDCENDLARISLVGSAGCMNSALLVLRLSSMELDQVCCMHEIDRGKNNSSLSRQGCWKWNLLPGAPSIGSRGLMCSRIMQAAANASATFRLLLERILSTTSTGR